MQYQVKVVVFYVNNTKTNVLRLKFSFANQIAVCYFIESENLSHFIFSKFDLWS
jgi:hypothetical protein